MTEKMYGNLQEKYTSSVLQSFSNFDFNSTIRKKYTGFCNCLVKLTGQAEHPNSFIHVLI